MKDLHIYGDSLLRGVIRDENGAYHSSEYIGFAEIGKRHSVTIKNMSMPTFTSVQISEWMKRSFAYDCPPEAVLIECGGNDCDMDWKAVATDPSAPHTTRVSYDGFISAYTGMIEFLRSYGCEPIIGILPPFSPRKYCDFLVNSGIDRAVIEKMSDVDGGFGGRHVRINAGIREIAAKYRCRAVEIGKFFPHDPVQIDAVIGCDGIHPNSEGYALVGKAIDEFLAG